MSALCTAANVFFPDLFKQLPHSETSILLLKLLVSLEFKNKPQIFEFHAIVKKAVITDFLETGWKHMHKEAPDKLLITEGNHTMGVTGFSATGTESCVCIRDRDDPAVRDSNLVGIASKIFDCITKPIECFFDIRASVFLIEGVFKGIPSKGCFLPVERNGYFQNI